MEGDGPEDMELGEMDLDENEKNVIIREGVCFRR